MLEVKFAKKEALALSREMAGLISGVLRGVGDLLFRRLNPLTIPKRRENAQAVREFQRSTASFDETDLFQYPLASGNDMKVPNGLRVARLVVMCNKGTMAVHTGRIADAAASVCPPAPVSSFWPKGEGATLWRSPGWPSARTSALGLARGHGDGHLDSTLLAP
mmetsp:Transcript_10417/g.33675  ORF Transcript_10417/g.33675 Transcript_10417/m.33675 type:complete len:163 (+) Transcript_10417:47-535(+)